MNTVADARPTLHVYEKGSIGPTLIFLHYYGGSHRTWQPVVSALPSELHVVAPDLRGWGQSDRPDTGYALADFADDIAAMIEARSIGDYVLVGHSMGGKIAQLLASRNPRGLRGLVLVAPAAPSPMNLPLDMRKGLASAYATRENIEGALAQALTSRPLPPHLHEQVVADSLAGSPAAKAAWPLHTSQEDITADVAHIRVPAMVISGSADKVDPVEVLKAELLPRLKDVQLHVVPGAGHLLPLEAPDAIANQIASFLHGRLG